ncbi:MAG: hypothetical protein HRU11_14305, partial [Parvularculaceae bacterium]|nr:hypothetical protein [Parvularculaceae bacterium]
IYQDQASPKDMYIEAALQAEDIAKKTLVAFGQGVEDKGSVSNLRA